MLGVIRFSRKLFLARFSFVAFLTLGEGVQEMEEEEEEGMI